jgi:hypothetical protein
MTYKKAGPMSSATIDPLAIPPRSISLNFAAAEEIHVGIEDAVKTLIIEASQDGTCGIRVTRHQPGIFTVALDDSVPFGETYEDFS